MIVPIHQSQDLVERLVTGCDHVYIGEGRPFDSDLVQFFLLLVCEVEGMFHVGGRRGLLEGEACNVSVSVSVVPEWNKR